MSKKILKKVFFILFMAVLWIGVGNSVPFTVFAAETPAEVIFSHEGGFYTDNVNLELSSADEECIIRYTIDGSEPTNSSLQYMGIPINITPRSDYPLQNHLNSGQNVESFVVLKARAFRGDLSSQTITHTYFIGDDIKDSSEKTKYGMPVASVTYQPEDFIGSNGMYSNPHNTDLTPQAFIEYFDEYGKLVFRHSAETKISGHASRSNPQKSLRLNFAKGKLENNSGLMGFDFFPMSSSNYYKTESTKNHVKMNFRISDTGNTNLREPFAHNLAAPLRMDIANSKSTAVFVNGEFWGVYEFREQYDNNFFAEHYDAVEKKDVVMLAFDWDTYNWEAGEPGSPLYKVEYSEGPDGEESKYYEDYMKMYNLVTGGRISDPNEYEKLKTMMDIDNYIDYIIPYVFLDNDDWPGNNVKMWRTKNEYDPEVETSYGADGRWRFVIHDFDIAFSSILRNTFRMFLTGEGSNDTNARQPAWATLFMRELFTNTEFRNTFTARLSTYTGTIFSYERAGSILNDLKTKFQPSLGWHSQRWNYYGDGWNDNINHLDYFMQNRTDFLLGFIREYYNDRLDTNIPQSFTNITFKTDSSKGWYDIAGAQIRPQVYGENLASSFTAKYLKTQPISISAVAQDGYRLIGYEVHYSNGEPYFDTNESITLIPVNDSLASITVTAQYEEYHPVKEIFLDPSELIIEESKEMALNASVLPENASNKSILWSSDDEEIATVDQEGNVMAVKEGTVIIRAVSKEDSNIYAWVVITVTPKEVPVVIQPSVSVTEVKISGVKTDISVEGKLALKAVINPANAANQTVEWTSDNPAAATVDKNGLVTGKDAGTVKITATVDGKSETVSITVHRYVSLRIGYSKAIENGKKVTLGGKNIKPFKNKGKIMLPLKFVVKSMGGKYQGNKVITVKYKQQKVKFQIGSNRAKIITGKTKKTVKLDTAIKKKGKHIYASLKTIRKTLGFKVYYKSKGKCITIDSSPLTKKFRQTRFAEVKKIIK